MKKILIALDNGPVSEKVALKGYELGKQLHAEIALVSVADTTTLVSDSGITPGEMIKLIKNDLRKTQEMIVHKVFKNFKVWTFVEEGRPYETILRIAGEWEADLIVLGTHGRTGISHLLTGSIAEKVIRHSAIPLLIIPTRS
jgi:nucleotide-binding universal stress UspA family protein